jgi:ribosome-associated protein
MDVEIRDDMIRLGQVLKLAGVVEDGAQAREAIDAGEVTVNDEGRDAPRSAAAPG